jgi:hypothetical protein
MRFDDLCVRVWVQVRGDFASKDFWMFDCSDLHGRKVAHAR